MTEFTTVQEYAMHGHHAAAQRPRSHHGIDELVGTALPTTTCRHSEGGKVCGKGAVILNAVLETKLGVNPSGSFGPVDITVCNNPGGRHVVLAHPTEGFGFKNEWYFKGYCVQRR